MTLSLLLLGFLVGMRHAVKAQYRRVFVFGHALYVGIWLRLHPGYGGFIHHHGRAFALFPRNMGWLFNGLQAVVGVATIYVGIMALGNWLQMVV